MVDPVSRRVSGNPYEAYYDQFDPAPVKNSSYVPGKPPGPLYDTAVSALVDKPTEHAFNADPYLDEMEQLLRQIHANPNAILKADIEILRAIFMCIESLKESHESNRSNAIQQVFKDKEVKKILQKEQQDINEKFNNSSSWSRFWDWVNKIFLAGNVAVVAAMIYFGGPVALPWAVGYLQKLLAVSQAATTSSKLYYDYKSGELEKQRIQIRFDLEKSNGKIKANVKKAGEVQRLIVELVEQRKRASDNYFRNKFS